MYSNFHPLFFVFLSQPPQQNKMSNWCEAGEHDADPSEMWYDFADCFECAFAKEYAEQMSISKKDAERIAALQGEGAAEKVLEEVLKKAQDNERASSN